MYIYFITKKRTSKEQKIYSTDDKGLNDPKKTQRVTVL